MECGVEAGEGGDLRIELRCGVDEGEGGGDVERRVVDGGAEGVEDLWRDAAVMGELRAAVNDAVADGVGAGA